MDRQVFHDIIKPLLIDDTLPLINWLKENEILPREKYCNGCEKKMNWTKYKKGRDGYIWKCQTVGCPEYKQEHNFNKAQYDILLFKINTSNLYSSDLLLVFRVFRGPNFKYA